MNAGGPNDVLKLSAVLAGLRRAARQLASLSVECVATLRVSLLSGAAHQQVDIIELAMGRTIACGEIRAAVAITRFMKPVITTRRPALVP